MPPPAPQPFYPDQPPGVPPEPFREPPPPQESPHGDPPIEIPGEDLPEPEIEGAASLSR